MDGADNVFIADAANHRVRRIDHRTGLITTIAGTAASGFTGDGGPAALATLSDPYGVFVDRAGRVLLTDTDNNRVRQVSASPAAQCPPPSAGMLGDANDVPQRTTPRG